MDISKLAEQAVSQVNIKKPVIEVESYVKNTIQNCKNTELFEIIEIKKPNKYEYTEKDLLKSISESEQDTLDAISASEFNKVWFKPGDVWCIKKWTDYKAKEGMSSQANIEYIAPIACIVDVGDAGYQINGVDLYTQRSSNKNLIKMATLKVAEISPTGSAAEKVTPVIPFLLPFFMFPDFPYPIYVIRKKSIDVSKYVNDKVQNNSQNNAQNNAQNNTVIPAQPKTSNMLKYAAMAAGGLYLIYMISSNKPESEPEESK
jgi:hypothetical protein